MIRAGTRMKLHLYLVQGPERDLFVSARGVKEAATLWRRHYGLTTEAPEYIFAVPPVAVRPSAHLWEGFTNHA